MSTTGPVPHPKPGMPAKFGRYRIVDRIGKGAMGVVYSARDDVMDRTVAIKVMMADLEGEPDTRERFFREARVAGQLLHPNIITVFDLAEEDGRLYIVMELLHGELLSQFLGRPEAASLETKIDLIVQVYTGLSVAHARDVFHRDIKPGNLFVQHDGTLKILDFGIARLASSNMTASGFIVGTPDYMSPEQARGEEVDARSDIFSAAAVFYMMLTGRKPFAAPDLPAVLHKVEAEDPPALDPDAVPPPLAAIITKALAKRRENRHQSCAEMIEDLTRFKRRYDARTRRRAELARQHYVAISELLAEQRSLAAALEIGCPVDDEEPLAGSLRQRDPVFAARGAQAFLSTSFKRPEIQRILDDLQVQHDAITQLVSPLRAAAAQTAQAEALLAAGNAAGALEQLRPVAQVVPDSPRVLAIRGRAQREMEAQRVRQGQLNAALAAADAHAAAGEWLSAVDEASRALAIDPASERATRIRDEALRRFHEERTANERRLQGHLDAARAALARGDIDAAERDLDAAARIPIDATDVIQSLRDEAAAAREVAEEAAERSRLAALEIESARARFATGDPDGAIALLRQYLLADPASRDVRHEIERLMVEQRRVQDDARRIATIDTYLNRAAAALSAGDVDGTMAAAQQALTLAPGSDAAVQLCASALARQCADSDRQTRTTKARAHVEMARQKLAGGDVSAAIAEACHAAAMDPDNGDAPGVLADALRAHGDAQLEAARARYVEASARRLRAAVARLERAAGADAAERGRAALAVLALDPGHEAALQIVSDAVVSGTVPEPPEGASSEITAVGGEPVKPASNRWLAWTSSVYERLRTNRGQTTTEWLMVAGILTAVVVLLLDSSTPFSLTAAFRAVVRSMAFYVRTVAP